MTHRHAPSQRTGGSRPAQEDDPATAFTRQRGTRWLEPRLLLRSAVQVVVSGLLGQYNDKRELMGSVRPDDVLDLSERTDEVWVDYVSDTGDGFDATYAVASLLAQPQLTLRTADGEDVPTPRAELLVMGGDQCYPSADVKTYEDRLIGPYRAALPHVPESSAPRLLVVPGNHDWYDGLTAFMRTFCQRRWIGGWRTCQARSYFAVKLPGHWWMWGIDIQFDTYIDDVQRQWFAQAAAQLEPGDAVILCSAKPSWVSTAEDDLEAYSTLDFLERTLIRPRGARVRVALSGDRHHYVRYASADGSQKITAGGGGAYLSPTHHLPSTLSLPPEGSRARGKSAPTQYAREAVFPDAERSRRLTWGALRLPWRTPSFAVLLGAVHTTLGVALGSALSTRERALSEQVAAIAQALRDAGPGQLGSALTATLGTFGLSLLVVGAAVAFTKRAGTALGLALGLTHGAVQLAVAVFATWAAASLTSGVAGGWMMLLLVPLVLGIGGLLGAEVVALYLVLADRFRLNSNELFAGQAVPDDKNFLRLRVDPNGELTVYPVGLERVPRDWRLQDRPVDEGPRWLPSGNPLDPLLIEPPVVVTRAPSGVPNVTHSHKGAHHERASLDR